MQALAGNDPFFESDAVFLNEVQSDAQAAQIIENAGNYDSSRDYYYIRGNNFYEVDTFTEAVNNNFFHDYTILGDTPPETIHEDTANYTWIATAWRSVALSRNLTDADRNREIEIRLWDSVELQFSQAIACTVGDWLDLGAKLASAYDSVNVITFPFKNIGNAALGNAMSAAFLGRVDATDNVICDEYDGERDLADENSFGLGGNDGTSNL